MSFLTAFFKTLNSSGIFYSVLRNHEHLPDTTNGSDLDILIDKSMKSDFFNLLNIVSAKYNGKIISYIDSSICPRVCVMGYKKTGWGLMIDVHYDVISYQNHILITKENIIKNTHQNQKKISVLNKKVDALNGLFKELLNNKNCSKRHWDEFKKSSLNKIFLNEIFTNIKKQKLVSVLMSLENKDFSKKNMNNLIFELNKYFSVKKTYHLINISKLYRLIKQPGFTIAFIGTDGSGKSTMIKNIIPTLNDAFHNSVYYEHMRPNLFPSIAELFDNNYQEKNITITNPHASSTSGFFVSLLRWFYYTLDYTFGFYFKIFPIKAIRSSVWIFDRYYYDYLIDPKRSRIKLPKFIFKFGMFFIPEPDIVFCLGADPKNIQNRKPELPIGEVKRQVNLLKKFCNNHKRSFWIDTDKDIEDSSKDVLNAIVEMMSRRFKILNNN